MQPLLSGRLASNGEGLKLYWCLMELPSSSPCKPLVLDLPVIGRALGWCEAPELGVLSATLGSLLWWAKFGSLGKELSRGHPRVALWNFPPAHPGRDFCLLVLPGWPQANRLSSLGCKCFIGERRELIRWPLRTLPAPRCDFRLLGLSLPCLTPWQNLRGG